MLSVSALVADASQLASIRGVTQVEGQDVVVDVLFVVPDGADANEVGLTALQEQGARPFQSQEFSLTGLLWDQFFDPDPGNNFVTQNYNPADDPTGGMGEAALLATHSTWNVVTTSTFEFSYGGTTTREPSLVKESKGPQTLDGYNDVAWMSLTGPNTLGVTWFSTTDDEADMALNTKFDWFTDGINNFDAETVFLHENGHVLGLGHSDVTGAVMEAYYGGPRQSLHADDIAGVSFLYPADADPVPGITVSPTSGLVTSESGGGAMFTVVLDTEPTANVTIDISTSDGAEGLVSAMAQGPATMLTLTFTLENWDTEQIVTVTGIDDGEIDGDVAYTIVTAAAASTDSDYNMLNADDVSVTNTDNDGTEATTVSVASITYGTEGGPNGDKHLSVTVKLDDNLGNPTSGASVSITLHHDSGTSWIGTATTGANGEVTFSLKNAPSGTYNTLVTAVDATGLAWDGVTKAVGDGPPIQYFRWS